MGRIIVPNRKIMQAPVMALPTVRVGGLVRCRINRGKSGTLKYDTGWFHNIITDDGIGYFANCPTGGAYGSQVAIFGNCAVGSGSGTPAVGDTQLFNLVATQLQSSPWTNSTGTGYVAAASPNPAYWWNQNTYTFPTGAATGNLTEIGIFPAGITYGAGLFSHALILDGTGNPTSITVLSDEVLTVTYQTNFYIDETDHAFSFPYNGATTTGIYRARNIQTVPDMNGNFSRWGNNQSVYPSIGFYTGDIGTVTGVNAGTEVLHMGANGTGNQSAFSLTDMINNMSVDGTWYYDVSITFPTGTSGTLLSIGYEHCFIKYQFGNLSTPITKTTGQQLQASFRASWGRH